MKRLLLLLASAAALSATDAANDLILSQRTSNNTKTIQRNVAPAASGLLGTDASKIPVAITVGTGLSLTNNTLAVSGGNGTGNVTGGSLTANAIVTGNGTTAIKVSGITVDASDNIVTSGNVTGNVGTFTSGNFTTGTITTANVTNLSGATANGQLLVGNVTTGNFSKVSMSGDATLAASGAITVANSAITNAKLANSTITLGNTTLTLGGTTTTVTGMTSVSSNNIIIASDSTINGVTIGRGAQNNADSTVIGSGALATVGGIMNTAIGRLALSNATSHQNTAIGVGAAQGFSGNSSASGMTAVGMYSLGYITSGASNTGLGHSSLLNVSTGSYNVGVGSSAGGNITTTNNGIFIGYGAGQYETSGNHVYIDSLDRTDLAGGRGKSLLWGTVNPTVASQQLTINAGNITLNGTTTVNGTLSATTLSGATISYASNTIQAQPDVWVIPIGDETTAITTGTAKVTFRAPYAATVTAVRASVNTASSSGLPTFDINEGGTTILSTKLTIDASELTSTTAATAAVISDTALADDAEITIDIDTAGTGAKGAKIAIYVTR